MIRINNCLICVHLDYTIKYDDYGGVESKRARCMVSKYNVGNLVTFPFQDDRTCCEPKDEYH